MAAIRAAVSALIQGSSTLLAKKELSDEEIEDVLRRLPGCLQGLQDAVSATDPEEVPQAVNEQAAQLLPLLASLFTLGLQSRSSVFPPPSTTARSSYLPPHKRASSGTQSPSIQPHPSSLTLVPAIALQLTRRVEWVDVGLGFVTSSSQASSDSGLSDREEGDAIERRLAALPLQELGSEGSNLDSGSRRDSEMQEGRNTGRWQRRPRNGGSGQQGGQSVDNGGGLEHAVARGLQRQRRRERVPSGAVGKTRASRVRREAVLVVQLLAAMCPRVLLAHWTAIMPVLPSAANAQDWPPSLLIPAFYDPCPKVRMAGLRAVCSLLGAAASRTLLQTARSGSRGSLQANQGGGAAAVAIGSFVEPSSSRVTTERQHGKSFLSLSDALADNLVRMHEELAHLIEVEVDHSFLSTAFRLASLLSLATPYARLLSHQRLNILLLQALVARLDKLLPPALVVQQLPARNGAEGSSTQAGSAPEAIAAIAHIIQQSSLLAPSVDTGGEYSSTPSSVSSSPPPSSPVDTFARQLLSRLVAWSDEPFALHVRLEAMQALTSWLPAFSRSQAAVHCSQLRVAALQVISDWHADDNDGDTNGLTQSAPDRVFRKPSQPNASSSISSIGAERSSTSNRAQDTATTSETGTRLLHASVKVLDALLYASCHNSRNEDASCSSSEPLNGFPYGSMPRVGTERPSSQSEQGALKDERGALNTPLVGADRLRSSAKGMACPPESVPDTDSHSQAESQHHMKSAYSPSHAQSHPQSGKCSLLHAQVLSHARPHPCCRHGGASLLPAQKEAGTSQAAVTVVWGPHWGLCGRVAATARSQQGGRREEALAGGGLGLCDGDGTADMSGAGAELEWRECREEGRDEGSVGKRESVGGIMHDWPQSGERLDRGADARGHVGEGRDGFVNATEGCVVGKHGRDGEEESLWMSVLRSETLVGAIRHKNPLVRAAVLSCFHRMPASVLLLLPSHQWRHLVFQPVFDAANTDDSPAVVSTAVRAMGVLLPHLLPDLTPFPLPHCTADCTGSRCSDAMSITREGCWEVLQLASHSNMTVRTAVFTALPSLIPLYSHPVFSHKRIYSPLSTTQQGPQPAHGVDISVGRTNKSEAESATSPDSSIGHTDSSAECTDGIAAVAAAASKAAREDSDKVRVHALKVLCSLIHSLHHRNGIPLFPHWLPDVITAVTEAASRSTSAKVHEHACTALDAFLVHDASCSQAPLSQTDRPARSTALVVFNCLLSLLSSSSHNKTRLLAAAALIRCPTREAYGDEFPRVLAAVAEAVRREHSPDGDASAADYHYQALVRTQVTATFLHLVAVATPSDLDHIRPQISFHADLFVSATRDAIAEAERQIQPINTLASQQSASQRDDSLSCGCMSHLKDAEGKLKRYWIEHGLLTLH